jgi:hypothetical protein
VPYGVVGEQTVTKLADLLLNAIFEKYPMLSHADRVTRP